MSAASSQMSGEIRPSCRPSAIQDSRFTSRRWSASHSGSGVATQPGFQYSRSRWMTGRSRDCASSRASQDLPEPAEPRRAMCRTQQRMELCALESKGSLQAALGISGSGRDRRRRLVGRSCAELGGTCSPATVSTVGFGARRVGGRQVGGRARSSGHDLGPCLRGDRWMDRLPAGGPSLRIAVRDRVALHAAQRVQGRALHAGACSSRKRRHTHRAGRRLRSHALGSATPFELSGLGAPGDGGVGLLPRRPPGRWSADTGSPPSVASSWSERAPGRPTSRKPQRRRRTSRSRSWASSTTTRGWRVTAASPCSVRSPTSPASSRLTVPT